MILQKITLFFLNINEDGQLFVSHSDRRSYHRQILERSRHHITKMIKNLFILFKYKKGNQTIEIVTFYFNNKASNVDCFCKINMKKKKNTHLSPVTRHNLTNVYNC